MCSIIDSHIIEVAQRSIGLPAALPRAPPLGPPGPPRARAADLRVGDLP